MAENKALAKRIEDLEKTIEIQSAQASILILPRGGRILGVDLGNGNLLWVNPKIEKVLKAGEWNTGGIRTWISPERSFFYENPEKFEGWRCPQGIDPANYRVMSKEALAVELESVVLVKDMISGENMVGRISKRLELLDVTRSTECVRARLRIRDVLTVRNFKPPFALWCLVQVPPGDSGRGTVTIPVTRNAQPLHYFDPIPNSYLRVLKNHTQFAIDGDKELKLGIRPEDLPKRQGTWLKYTFKKNGKNTTILVSSQTGARRQEECVDPAKSNPEGYKAVVQAYNSEYKSSGLRFGELEIQGAQAKIDPNGNLVAREDIIADITEKLS